MAAQGSGSIINVSSILAHQTRARDAAVQGAQLVSWPVVATVQTKTGKMLKVVANGDDLGVPLATREAPAPEDVEVDPGAAKVGEAHRVRADPGVLHEQLGEVQRAPVPPRQRPVGDLTDDGLHELVVAEVRAEPVVELAEQLLAPETYIRAVLGGGS